MRGGQELYRSLALSQFKQQQQPDRYFYTENSSKTNKEASINLNLNIKLSQLLPILKLESAVQFISWINILVNCPSRQKKWIFYFRPYSKLPKNAEDPWFIANPIGKNTLGNMVQQMCKDTGIQGNISNHSLRVAGTMSLFNAGEADSIAYWPCFLDCTSQI